MTIFFTITDDVASFRKQLGEIVPHITTTVQAQHIKDTIIKNKQEAAAKGTKPDEIPVVGVTLAFSKFGLTKVYASYFLLFLTCSDLVIQMGITENTQDAPFEAGQFGNIGTLNDNAENWLPVFKDGVHGVIIVAGNCREVIDPKVAEIRGILGTTIHEVFHVIGKVRPGEEKGHEQ